MDKFIARLIVSLALVAGAVLMPSPAHAYTYYSVDMNQACQIQHGLTWKAKLLDANNAYSWRCWVPPWGVEKGLNVQQFCTYKAYGTAVVLDPNNAYSWRCRS